jgi:hypothetical protein
MGIQSDTADQDTWTLTQFNYNAGATVGVPADFNAVLGTKTAAFYVVHRGEIVDLSTLRFFAK